MPALPQKESDLLEHYAFSEHLSLLLQAIPFKQILRNDRYKRPNGRVTAERIVAGRLLFIYS